MSLSIEGLIFQGFWAQRPYYIRLLGYFDAKGVGFHTVSCKSLSGNVANPAQSAGRTALWWGRIIHRPLGSSFLGLPYRILNLNHKKGTT